MTCVFCEIVAGRAPAHVIYEDDRHLAFLSIFPNSEGASVVIPKEHHSSYIADIPSQVAHDLHTTAMDVARLLDRAFDDSARTAMVYEGYGVDHVHAKLFPLHGTAAQSDQWQAINSDISTYYDRYPGYVSSHDSDRADDDILANLAAMIRDHA